MEAWAPAPDARTVSAKWRNRCINCNLYSEPGTPITGTKRDGWACEMCTEQAGERRQLPEWALAVGARAFRSKWDSLCCLCGTELRSGTNVWLNVCGGVVCGACATTVPPSYYGVVEKVAARMKDGLPVNLTLADLASVTDRLAEHSTLSGVRFGDEKSWTERAEALGRETVDYSRVRSLGEAFGLLLDAQEHRFNPNLRTNWVLALIRSIEDPASNDDDWAELLRKRGAGFAADTDSA